MSSLGRLTEAELTPVQGNIQLRNGPAQAFLRVHHARPQVTIARPYGGYRWAGLQDAMRAAGLGHDPAEKARFGLDTRSTVTIAAHPNGTHEDGGSVDLVGFPITEAWLAWLRSYGFTRTFGAADPRHFAYHQELDRHRPVPAERSYTVKRGDTAGAIARAHHITLERLDQLNAQLHGPEYLIYVGEKLAVR